MTRMLRLESTEIDANMIVRTFRVARATALAFQDFGGFTIMVDDNHISVETGTFEDASSWNHVLHDEMIAVGIDPNEYRI